MASVALKRIEESMAIVAALRATTFVCGALTAVMVARLLGPHDRGVWSVTLLVSGLVALASELGVGVAVLRFARQDNRRELGVGISGLLLTSLASVLAVGAVVLTVHFSALPGLSGIPPTIMILALASAAPTNVTTVSRQLLLEDGDLLGVALSQALQALLVLGLISVGFQIFGVDLLVGLSSFFLAQLAVGGAVLTRAIRRGLAASKPSRAMMGALLTFGVQAHLGTLALFLAYRFDLLLVNRLLGATAAGVYSIALTLSEILRVFPEAGQMRVFSLPSAAGQQPQVAAIARPVLLVTAIGGVSLAALSVWLVPLVFGAAFSGAAPAFAALVPGIVALAVSYTVSPVLVLRGRIRANSVAASASLVVMIALDLVVIPRWGLLGAGCVSSVAYAVLALLQLHLTRREQPFHWRELVPTTADLRVLVSWVVTLRAHFQRAVSTADRPR
jgi:O-antigen/teichoic acid export membrane protein